MHETRGFQPPVELTKKYEQAAANLIRNLCSKDDLATQHTSLSPQTKTGKIEANVMLQYKQDQRHCDHLPPHCATCL